CPLAGTIKITVHPPTPPRLGVRPHHLDVTSPPEVPILLGMWIPRNRVLQIVRPSVTIGSLGRMRTRGRLRRPPVAGRRAIHNPFAPRRFVHVDDIVRRPVDAD